MEDKIKAALKEKILGLTARNRTNQGVMDHPLLTALDHTALTADQLKQFADIRYNAASRFENMLARAQELAEADPEKKALAEELQENLNDERGQGRSAGKGAHSEWRSDFLNAIGVKVHEENEIPLYSFTPEDDLATLTGILLAAEYTIPPEDNRVLKSMRNAFPETFTDGMTPDEGTPEQQRNTLYLRDHIQHDAQSHFPDLMKEVAACFHRPEDQEKLMAGIERFAAERQHLYNAVQQKLGLDFSTLDQKQGFNR